MEHFKFKKIFHLPWSRESVDPDDRILENTNNFVDKRVIVSIKFDGENTSVYNDYTHARSMDSGNYAKHSILYSKLKSYFLVFSIWNQNLKILLKTLT